MTHRIFAITTHHKYSEEAAEEWKKLGICAIGWSPIDFSKCKSIDEIKRLLKQKYRSTSDADQIWRFQRGIDKGDLILAYARHNTIAYVGESKGHRKFNKNNTIGDPEGKYRYANQMQVMWWDEPRYFDRWDLPEYISNQFGKRHITVTEINPGSKGFEGFVAIVKSCARSDSKLPGMKEDMVKAGLIKYLHRSLDALETGLKIEQAELFVGEKRPDFIAKDKGGRTVLIECKGNAGLDTVEQIKRYEVEFSKRKNPRLMIVAFRINEACRLAAKKAGNIELYECDLDFKAL